MSIPTLYDDRVRRKAVAHLRAADPALAAVIARVGRCRFTPRAEGSHFDTLVYAIVFQQISGKAATAIHNRLCAEYGGRSPRPDDLLDTPDADLRAVGLSRQKIAYLRDLSEKVSSGAVPLDAIDELGDEEVEADLTSVKGIGRWTAQMFLMFRLGRPDIFPEFDLGIRKGVQLVHGLESLPPPKVTAAHGEAWRPYRTIAAWYLWRSQE
jgi:DNA-3-methyladenine glycosylase II